MGARIRPVATAAAALAIALSAWLLDCPVARLAHDSWHRPAAFVALTRIADWPVPIAAVLLLGAGAASLAGWRPGRRARAVLAGAVAVLLAREAADLLKFAFGRPWPETWIDHAPSFIGTGTFGLFPFHGGRGYASFPSGHETDIATPAALLWRTRRMPARIAAATLAALVGVGLVVSDYHFVSDVLAGLALGVAVASGTMALLGPAPAVTPSGGAAPSGSRRADAA